MNGEAKKLGNTKKEEDTNRLVGIKRRRYEMRSEH